MEKERFYAAVSAVIRNKEWKILFLKSHNSEYENGLYNIPAGHIDEWEWPFEAIIRELKEELWIDVARDDLRMYQVSRDNPNFKNKMYIWFRFEVLSYSWEIKNMEPHKVEKLEFLDYDGSEKFSKFCCCLKDLDKEFHYTENDFS